MSSKEDRDLDRLAMLLERGDVNDFEEIARLMGQGDPNASQTYSRPAPQTGDANPRKASFRTWWANLRK